MGYFVYPFTKDLLTSFFLSVEDDILDLNYVFDTLNVLVFFERSPTT
ncbi:hypothetical protein Hanom_Chr13g01183781 [Helianthus anomalus]